MAPAPLPYPAPPLSDDLVTLRPWSEGDVDCVRQASSDPGIPQGTTVPAIWTPQEGLAFVHRQQSRATDGTGVSMAVVEAASGRAVGLVVVMLRPQARVAGLGYWVVPGARRRGLAGAAVRLVVPWALPALDLQRLEAWVVPDNLASRAVLAAAGFREEGLLRSFLSGPDGPLDAVVCSVVEHDVEQDVERREQTV